MEGWEHVTTAREVARGGDSPVRRHSTRVAETREVIEDQREVDSDQPPYIEEQSGSKDNILLK